MLPSGQQQGGVLRLTVSGTLRPPIHQTLHARRTDWSDPRGLLSRRGSNDLPQVAHTEPYGLDSTHIKTLLPLLRRMGMAQLLMLLACPKSREDTPHYVALCL